MVPNYQSWRMGGARRNFRSAIRPRFRGLSRNMQEPPRGAGLSAITASLRPPIALLAVTLPGVCRTCQRPPTGKGSSEQPAHQRWQVCSTIPASGQARGPTGPPPAPASTSSLARRTPCIPMDHCNARLTACTFRTSIAVGNTEMES